MITDRAVPNIFMSHNNWEVNVLKCKKRNEKMPLQVSLEKIISRVIWKTKISQADFFSRSQFRYMVEARQFYFKLARDNTKASLKEIGSMVLHGNHANVLYGIKQVETVPSLKDKYYKLFKEFT